MLIEEELPSPERDKLQQLDLTLPSDKLALELKETIRNYVDFELGNSNINYYKPACEFYDSVAKRASRAGTIIDVFSCCLNQVGLYEMKNLVALTGGYMIFTDSFSTMVFQDSVKKIFELDENGEIKKENRSRE